MKGVGRARVMRGDASPTSIFNHRLQKLLQRFDSGWLDAFDANGNHIPLPAPRGGVMREEGGKGQRNGRLCVCRYVFQGKVQNEIK